MFYYRKHLPALLNMCLTDGHSACDIIKRESVQIFVSSKFYQEFPIDLLRIWPINCLIHRYFERWSIYWSWSTIRSHFTSTAYLVKISATHCFEPYDGRGLRQKCVKERMRYVLSLLSPMTFIHCIIFQFQLTTTQPILCNGLNGSNISCNGKTPQHNGHNKYLNNKNNNHHLQIQTTTSGFCTVARSSSIWYEMVGDVEGVTSIFIDPGPEQTDVV